MLQNTEVHRRRMVIPSKQRFWNSSYSALPSPPCHSSQLTYAKDIHNAQTHHSLFHLGRDAHVGCDGRLQLRVFAKNVPKVNVEQRACDA